MRINTTIPQHNLREVPKAAAAVEDAGYDGIELRGYDIDGQKSTAEYLDLVHSLTQKYQLKVTFGCPNNTVDPDAAVRKESLENFKFIM